MEKMYETSSLESIGKRRPGFYTADDAGFNTLLILGDGNEGVGV
jgi:hypothetical protein